MPSQISINRPHLLVVEGIQSDEIGAGGPCTNVSVNREFG